MTEKPNAIPDNIITELIAAIVAARADGDGVLAIAAVRERLTVAKLRVERVEDASKLPPAFDNDDDYGGTHD
jgi:hypothetical protein